MSMHRPNSYKNNILIMWGMSKVIEYAFSILAKMRGNTQVRFAEVDVTCLKLPLNSGIFLKQDNCAQSLFPLTIKAHFFKMIYKRNEQANVIIHSLFVWSVLCYPLLTLIVIGNSLHMFIPWLQQSKNSCITRLNPANTK